jgi:hypothetical protein
MKNEKWATIISGQPRADIIKAKSEYQEFIKDIGVNPDVFSHMMISDEVLSFWGRGGWSGKSPIIHQPDDILKIWNPKKHFIDNYDNFDFKNQNYSAGLSMTYGIKKSFELLKQYEDENHIKYDYVIKWRYDLNYFPVHERRKDIPLFGKLKSPWKNQSCYFWGEGGVPEKKFIEEIDMSIDWNWIKKEISDDNTVVLSPGWGFGGYGYCDMFLIGTRNSMEKYSNYHDKFLEIRKNIDSHEGILQYYLENVMKMRVSLYYFGDIGIHR